MKICSLDLIAFGPFTDRKLDFGKTPAGMTVISGPNEAGKSSVLRAIRGALYGIPTLTDDNFLHSNRTLRIGIELLDKNGELARFVRRKGRKDTLLSIEGDALDESLLAGIYHGISSSLFSSLFGITHRDLTQGGEDILNQQGELGQTLFSASSARKNLHQILKKLDESADALFKSKGQNQAINTGLKSYAELKKKLIETSLNSDDWVTLQESFEKTAKRVDVIALDIKECDRKLNELQRAERLLPKVATRQQLQSQISALGNVKQLDASFSARRQTAVSELISSRSTEQSLISRRDDLARQMARNTVGDELLSLETTIQSLYQRMESYTRAYEQLPIYHQKNQLLDVDLSASLQTIQQGLKIEEIDKLIPVLGREPDIKSAVAHYQALKLEQKQYTAAAFSSKQKLKTLGEQRADPIDEELLLRLQQNLQQAQQYSGLETELRDVKSDTAVLLSQINSAITALPYWNGSAEDLQTLPVPGKQTVHDFDKHFVKNAQELDRLNAEFTRLDSELQLLDEKTLVLKSGGELPSQQELEEVRNSRNSAWSLIKNQWVDNVDVTLEAGFLDAKRKLPEAFEWRLYKADEIADRLRRDSDRVAQLEGLRTESLRIEKLKQGVSVQLQSSEKAHRELIASWLAEWQSCGIDPRSPGEMAEWRTAREEILRKIEEVSLLKVKASRLEAIKGELFTRILAKPCPLAIDETGSLNSVIAEMGVWIETTQKASQTYTRFVETTQRLEDEFSAANSKLTQTSHSIEQWQVNWDVLVDGLGLTVNSEPNTAIDRLQQIRDAFAKYRDLRELDSTIINLKREIHDFDSTYAELGIDAGILSKRQHVPEIYKQFGAQKQAEAVRIQNSEEQTKLKTALDKASREREASALQMSHLLAEASCNNEAELPDLERRSAELVGLKQRLSIVEQDILKDGGGKTLEEIESSVKGLDAASLSAEINDIRQKISSELEPRKQELSEERGSKRKELESMQGSPEVALIAEAAEETLAKIRKNVARFMQLKTAAKLLRDEIERFRKKNQGPLLEIAGRYFSELTLGSFVSLGSDFSTQDKVILIAERKTGEKVAVEGMSSGTRDQLYLALRLAAFERSLEQRGPMPFIVDDILIEFDDERSQAALEILSRLAKKTQIILFSHHPRVIELSKAVSHPPALISL